MQKSSQLFLSLLVISGMLFSACGTPEEQPESNDEGLHIEFDLESETMVDEPEEETVEEAPESTEEVSANDYENGTYSATGAYQSPAGPETIDVSLTIEDDIVTAVAVTANAENQTSLDFQNKFSGGVSTQVVGMDLDKLSSVGNTAGSSLTPKGFNDALASIKAQAAL